MAVINTVFSDGKFVPLEPVKFSENQQVRLRIVPPEMTDEEFTTRVDGCKSVDELVAFCQQLPKDENGDEIEMLKWIDETRRETGYRLPFEARS
jgi:predicted DNA-binding antitoxin AbrB/MazE fold protein